MEFRNSSLIIFVTPRYIYIVEQPSSNVLNWMEKRVIFKIPTKNLNLTKRR